MDMFQRIICLLLLLASAAGCTDTPRATYPDRRAGRGEPCLVLNDCKEPLLCLGGLCLDAKPPVAASNKQCARAECLTSEDCCEPLQNFQRDQCASLEAQCSAGTLWACDEHERQCVCTRRCEGHMCIGGPASCSEDRQCGFGNVCHEERCKQCAFDVNCPEGFVCVADRCQQGCNHDGQCGALETCHNRRCEPRGCLDHLECISLLRRRDAVCRKEECVIPCASDAACGAAGGLQTCIDGVCRDLGCASDADCEAQAAGAGDRSIMLCLDADQASRLQWSDPLQPGPTL
jgi:hypothetical protein